MNLAESPQTTDKKVRLHFLCGKIASGKSTLAKQLAKQPRTILLSEDEWLSTLTIMKLRN